MSAGLVDTNIFIHAHSNDAHSAECRAFLRGLEAGTVSARLEAVVAHELSYALPHYVKGMTRQQVGDYLLMVLAWPGVTGETDVLTDAVQAWQEDGHVAFVDAYLTALALRANVPVFSKNTADIARRGVLVPAVLPGKQA